MSNIDVFGLWTQEEIQSKGFERVPLAADDYISMISKVNLVRENKYQSSEQELSFEVYFLVYKSKNEDVIKDRKWQEKAPLTEFVRKKVNPRSIGFTKDGTPSNLRAILAYAQGIVPDPITKIPVTHVIVVDRNEKEVTGDEKKEYLQEVMAVANQTMKFADTKFMAAGYTHFPDLRVFTGKYVGTSITSKDGVWNVVSGFNKVPSNFKPDENVEKEWLVKFQEILEKIEKKKSERTTTASAPSNTSSKADMITDDISVEDIPF